MTEVRVVSEILLFLAAEPVVGEGDVDDVDDVDEEEEEEEEEDEATGAAAEPCW